MSSDWMKLGKRHRQELIACEQEAIPGCMKLMKRIHKLEIELLAEKGNTREIRKQLKQAIDIYEDHRIID